MSKAILVDTTRCTACRGCQIACKDWHNLPANKTKQTGTHQNPPDLNPYNYKIVRFSERINNKGNVVWNFFPDQCRHCVHPICVDVSNMILPGAIIKDKQTGAVLATELSAKLTDKDAQTIIDACPYNIPRRDPNTKRITKCDMCIDRQQAGMPPICVRTCPTGAMVYGEREEILALAQKRLAKAKERHPEARLIDQNDVSVVYLLAEDGKYYHKYASFM
ncbi:formate dehydrogenase [Desulfovibrio sp. OttesenSCG-928-F07]|nr:formate dehydrogenase [Desulfovibrio sp. OttesenSCG-928-F07]